MVFVKGCPICAAMKRTCAMCLKDGERALTLGSLPDPPPAAEESPSKKPYLGYRLDHSDRMLPTKRAQTASVRRRILSEPILGSSYNPRDDDSDDDDTFITGLRSDGSDLPASPHGDDDRANRRSARRWRSFSADLPRRHSTGWGKFKAAMEDAGKDDILEAIEKDVEKAQRVVEHKQRIQMQMRISSLWEKLRSYVRKTFKPKGWRELIDFEALQLLRDERDREREREREELARRLREEAALRALEAAEEERRRRASRELLQQQREEWEADQRRKTAEKVRRQNEAEARSEQELAAHRRMTQLYATESQKQLAAKRAREKREADLAARRQARLDKKLRLLEKLTKIKGRPSNISLTSWLGRNPEYVPHSQWPPLKPDQKREKVVNCRSGLDKDAKVEASFVQQKAIVPAAAVLPQQPPQRQMMVRVVRPEVIIRPVSPSPKPPPNSRPNTAHTAARELLAVGINSSSGDLRPRTPTRLPELSLGDGLPNATPITKSWSNLRKKQAGAAIVTLGRSASAASLDQPVKGTVPFTSPGLLTPAQKKAHARKTGPITRGSTGDCGRLLSETMEGGQAHLLPVADIIDLQIVLVLAGIECYSWADGRLVELLDELTSLDACFNSVKSDTLRPSHNAAPWEEDPFPLCPHLLLKRKVLYVHVLSDCGELELMQRIEANDGRVEHRRICARVTDRMAPARFAVSLVAEALGVEEDTVRQLDAHPIVSQSDPAPCTYPAVLCEHLFYVIRLHVEGLPQKHGFSTQGADWAWKPAAVGRSAHRLRHSPRPSSTSLTAIQEKHRPSSRTPSRSEPRLLRYADMDGR